MHLGTQLANSSGQLLISYISSREQEPLSGNIMIFKSGDKPAAGINFRNIIGDNAPCLQGFSCSRPNDTDFEATKGTSVQLYVM